MRQSLRILLFLTILLSVHLGTLAERFRVMNESVSVYAEPERITKLGSVHRGEEYESEGTEGSMYIFRFNGRKAYVASYCCKPVEDKAELSSAATNVRQNEDNVVSQQKEDNVVSQQKEDKGHSMQGKDNVVRQSDETPNYFKWLDEWDRKRNANANVQMPEWLSILIAVMMFLGLAVGCWTLWGTQSCDNFFDSLAGRRVTWCSKATHFRPLILLFGGSTVFYITQNINVTLTIAVIYELILLSFRAKKIGSFRAAIVEALYLFFYGMGTLLLCWMYIILLFLGSGGTSKGSKRDVNRRCGRCAYYVKDIPCDHCSLHTHNVHPDDYCESFRPH